MRARVQGVAILACTAVVATAGFTAAVASAADSQGAAPAAVVLLSRNRPVTASSAGGCCAPRNAVDGKSTTRWASTAGKDPQWIYVDLGAVAMVSRARLQWDRSCATAYQLQTSTNHTTWTTIFSTTTGKGGVEDRTGLTGSGRYLRMLGTHRCRSDGTHGYSLQELDVFGIIGDPQPPTAPGPPAAGSAARYPGRLRPVPAPGSRPTPTTSSPSPPGTPTATSHRAAPRSRCTRHPGRRPATRTATPTSSRCSTAPHWTAGPSPGRTVGSSGTARSTVRAPAAAGSTTTRARSAASGGSSTFARSPATTHRRC